MQRMTDAQRALVVENLPLVTWVLQNKTHHWKRDEYDDLFQTGAIGLCKAAIRYDEGTGVRFGTYAHECILGEIRNEIRRLCRQRIRAGAARLEDAALQGTDEITRMEQTADVEDGAAMERMIILKETLGRIKGMEREALDLHIAGFRQLEIGRRVKASQPSVHRILRRARKLVADEYAR